MGKMLNGTMTHLTLDASQTAALKQLLLSAARGCEEQRKVSMSDDQRKLVAKEMMNALELYAIVAEATPPHPPLALARNAVREAFGVYEHEKNKR